MPYNPKVHHRQSTRLHGFDYSEPGAYFVTICTYQRECLFDEARLKRVAELQWRSVGRYCREATMDEFVVMPNHVHGIIWIGRRESAVGAQHTAVRPSPSNQDDDGEQDQHLLSACAAPLHSARPGSLAAIVRAFKSSSTKRVNELRGTPRVPVWQRGYWDRIIRNERELNNVRQYIQDNPLKWADDPNHPANAL